MTQGWEEAQWTNVHGLSVTLFRFLPLFACQLPSMILTERTLTSLPRQRERNKEEIFYETVDKKRKVGKERWTIFSTFRQPTPLQCQDNGDGIYPTKNSIESFPLSCLSAANQLTTAVTKSKRVKRGKNIALTPLSLLRRHTQNTYRATMQ